MCKTIERLIVFALFMAFAWPALAGTPFPGGERDSITPQVKLLKPTPQVKLLRPRQRALVAGEEITVRVEFSKEFDYCPDCATNPNTEYAAVGQVDLQGHVHAYFRKIPDRGFPDDREADSFCPFNFLNPSTVQLSDTVVETKCPPLEVPGPYQMCVTLETNAHAQRIKAAPRDFPPVDCMDITVK